MANKFQKSIMERLEQDAARQKPEKPPVKIKEAEAPEDTVPVKEWKTEETRSVKLPIEEYLRIEPQRSAKNKTFYLDVEVIDRVRQLAREKGIADSKLVNDVLRKVLGL